MQISTLRPGLLVSLHTGLRGNVTYKTREIEADHFEGDGSRRAKWETDRVIQDAAEHEDGVKARGKARSLITAICAPSSFGLLCPEDAREKLTDAIAEAHRVVDRFNARASITRCYVAVIVGRVASDDVEAIRAINGELRMLLETMAEGVQKLDVKIVREAANKARALSAMLSPEAAFRANQAIEAARRAARDIVRAGETAAIAIDEQALRTIRESRTAFLDMDDVGEAQTPEPVGRAIDFDVAPMPAIASPIFVRPALEME